MDKTLQVEHLEKYYGSRSSLTKAIDDLSFDVEPQEFVCKALMNECIYQ